MPSTWRASEPTFAADPTPQENNILLQKLIKIRNFDSTKAFKPWLARSTFQYSPGTFYDPTTGAKCVDHFNVTATVSPRRCAMHACSGIVAWGPAARASE